MSEILNSAIVKVQNAKYAFCRFITANDTGKNGSHQAGFYIPKCAAALLFDTPGVKGENKDKMVKVKWQDDFTTDSRFIYYGQGTRNEYRITRFGKGFPFFEEDNVGDLLIIAQQSEDYYYGFVLQTDQDIDDFFAIFSISASTSASDTSMFSSLAICSNTRLLWIRVRASGRTCSFNPSTVRPENCKY